MLVALLLLAAPDPFEAVFDPASDAQVRARKVAFDNALRKKGVGAAIRSFRKFEKLAAEGQASVDKVYATYKKKADAYWGYRKKTGAVAEAVPAKLNQPFLDWELVWKGAANKMRRLRTVQDWAVERVVEFLKPPLKKRAMGALVSGLKDRNPHQRWRCARLLGKVGDEKALAALANRARAEKDPGVLAEIVRAHRGETVVQFAAAHSEWQVRAAAAPLLKDTALKEARRKVEKGRVLDDLGGKPGPTECFGIRSSSRRVVFCFDYPGAVGHHVIAAIKTLPPDALFSIVICGGKVHRFKKKLVSGMRDAAVAFIKKTKTDGRSDLYAGLRAAIDMKPDTIFLLTAGGGGGSPFWTQVMYPDPMQVGPEIQAYNRLRGVRIHGAGPSGARKGYWLENLTKQFGGSMPRK